MKKLLIPGILLAVALVLFIVPTVVAQSDFTSELLGGLSSTSLAVYAIYAYTGVLLNIISDIIRRNPSSPTSPEKLNFDYWWKDNWKRLCMSLILVPIAIILYSELFEAPLDKLSALGLGLGSDHILELIKRKKNLGV